MAFYKLLLRLYPASFRYEYAPEMCADFVRRRRDAASPLASLLVWLEAIADIGVTAARVHVDLLRQDARYIGRTMKRAPGFAVTAVALVAFGIGATTAAFSVTDFVLVRPLPFPGSSRLVKIWERHPGFERMQLSPSNYRDLKRAVSSLETWGAYRGLAISLAGTGEPEYLRGAVLTSEVFSTLGVAPLVGRTFTAADDREDAAATVVLSYRLWQTHFGGGDAAIGATTLLDGRPYTVIGVMPSSFYFPNRDAVLWTPMRFAPSDFVDRNDNYLEAVGRLRSGATLTSARAELAVAASQLKRTFPKENANTDFSAIAIRDEIGRGARIALLSLSGAALCVLLIACSNLANLLLARGVARARELAVRSAMGAGRERLVRQLLTESLLIAAAGGVLGVALGWAAVPLLSRLVPIRLPVAGAPAIDYRVLAFAAFATVGVGLLFGLAPVWAARGAAGASALRATVRAGGGRRDHLRSALVVVEIVASVVLLVSVGLLLQ
ncbi:MAG TPA: ABC transporter permease, partial [Vicinamibacterales bacterium]|nr:ABC transporter permease [Vicinamibacterales bacterium]